MILEQLFLITAFVGAVMAVLNIIGANIYDAREIKQRRQFNQNPCARQYRNRPLISVLISTHNDEAKIERCLSSLLAGSYRKVEIIVVDAASQDQTRRLVRQCIADHPKRTIRLVARQAAVNTMPDLIAAFKKHGHGELVLHCDAGSTIDKQALANAVRHYNAEPAIDVVTFNRRVVSAFSTVGLFQKYEHLLRYRSQKFNSISNSDYALVTRSEALYRRELFILTIKSIMQIGNKNIHTYYASDAVIYTDAASSLFGFIKQRYRLQFGRVQALRSQSRVVFKHSSNYTKFLTWFRLPFSAVVGLTALFLPVLLTDFIYVALKLHEPTLFMLSWIILGVLLLLAVWGDEHLKLHQKAAYSFFIPITYVIFYLLSFVQIFVLLRALLPRRNPLGHGFAVDAH